MHTLSSMLTGTAAIRVGLRTVQSPLLPFLILLDCKESERTQISYFHGGRGLSIREACELKPITVSTKKTKYNSISVSYSTLWPTDGS